MAQLRLAPMPRLQSVLISRFILNLRVSDSEPDWLLTSGGAGGDGEPSILTFGHMGAPLDFDGDTDRLERTTGIEMEEGVTESARS